MNFGYDKETIELSPDRGGGVKDYLDTRFKLDRRVLRVICGGYALIGIVIGASCGWHVGLGIYLIALAFGWWSAKRYDAAHPPVD